jgi:HEPN domain-containing protein
MVRSYMNPLVHDWIEKAEGDFYAAERELRVRKNPAYHVTCFLSQQFAEKYLKAFLQYQKQEIPKIHNLIDLLILIKQVDPSLEILRPDLEVLERYSVRVRYPGMIAEKEDARAAFSSAKVVRKMMRRLLELSTDE